MEYSRALFKIDSDSSLPIKEQIKLLIGKDLLKLGDTLPSTNQRGKGTQVASVEKINQFKTQNPYFSFLE